MGPLSDMDLAYVAGLFDGEGCVSIRRYYKNPKGKPCEIYTLWVQVTNVDPRVVFPLREKFNGSVHTTRHKSPTQRDTHVWICTSTNAMNFLKAVRPWLVAKAEQADIGIAFQAAKTRDGWNQHTGRPDWMLENERRQFHQIAELKFRTFDPTDFGMQANSGNRENRKSRAKQEPQAPGVCND